MRRRAFFPSLLFAAAAALLPGVASALEEVSLLTSDGTLHDLRTGTALELGVVDKNISPNAWLIDWTSRAQDGTVTMAILPDTVSFFDKHGLDLAYDDQTQTLLLLRLLVHRPLPLQPLQPIRPLPHRRAVVVAVVRADKLLPALTTTHQSVVVRRVWAE